MLTTQDVELLKEAQIGIVATNQKGRAPQLTPVWVDTDGETVIFNTAKGRVKHHNVLADPMVSMCVVDSSNPYRWVSVRGIAEIVDDLDCQHINSLAKKYLNKDTYPLSDPNEERIIVKIRPLSRIGR